MRRLALFVIAVLLASSTVAPVTLGQLPIDIPSIPGTTPGAANNTTGNQTGAAPVMVQLYLSSAQAALAGTGAVETLVAAAPAKADDSLRNVSTGVAWYEIAGTVPELRDARLLGNVAGMTTFIVTPDQVPPLGLLLNAQITFTLQKVGASGNTTVLSSDTEQIQQPVLTAPGSPQGPVTTTIQWSLSGLNTTISPGEGLALNVSATTQGIAALQVAYDSSAHPSGFNLTVVPNLRGSLSLSAATAARDSQPGGSPTYVVTVRNQGTNAETVTLTVAGTPSDWQVSITPASLNVNSGLTGSALVTLRVPSTATEGARHTATVTAAGSSGATAQPLALVTTVRAAGTGTGATCQVTGQLDTDCDGSTDVEERRYGSNPNDRNSTPDNTDSDGDGASNKAEIDAGCDYQNPNDVPLTSGGCGPLGSGNAGGGSGNSFLGGFGDTIASTFGISSAQADLVGILLILLFLLILLLLIWFLLIGGYPVKVLLIEPRATTEPGRPVDYTIELQSRLRKAQQVDLEVSGLPNDWDVRLNQPRLTLEPKASQTIGMLIRPPDNWPAPSKREFQVRARSRLKPGSFAKALAKLLIEPRPLAPIDAPLEEAVPEPAYEPTYQPPAPDPAYAPSYPPSPPPYTPPPPPVAPVAAPVPVAAPRGVAAFRVLIGNVKHTPEVPERGGEVVTKARIDNNGPRAERIRVVLVVNGKVRDEVAADLEPGESAEAEFHWVAYLARNEVKVVAERA